MLAKIKSPEQKNEVFKKNGHLLQNKEIQQMINMEIMDFFEVDNNTAAKNKHINSKYINFFLLELRCKAIMKPIVNMKLQ